MTERSIHESRNVKRIREILGMKQDTLALELGLSQQAISALEQKEALDKDMLEKIAGVLKVPSEAIKNYDDEKAINFISNSFNDNATVNNYPIYNTDIKLAEALEENKRLYIALLKEKDEKIALMEVVGEKIITDRAFIVLELASCLPGIDKNKKAK